MNSINKIIVMFLASLIMGTAQSQSCYPGFDYRQAIEISSSALNNAYTEFQVAVDVPTAALVAAGKAKYNGDDFRFKDAAGNNLSYWFDPLDYDQLSTRFWVKVPTLPVGSTTIYMYYGNPSAAGVANGEATFNLFDSFESAGVDALKWNQFGINTNISLSGGKCTFNQDPANPEALLVSKTSYTDTLTVEMNTITASNGIAALGLVDASNNGFVSTYENGNMLMQEVSGATPQFSKLLLAPSVAVTAVLNPAGLWSFNWNLESSQSITFPTGTSTETRSDFSASFVLPKKVIVGVQNGPIGSSNISGSLQIDWIRGRKYAVVEPVSIFSGVEEEYPNSVNLVSTGPYCEGETFQISADIFAGASYSWKKNTTALSYTTESFTIPSVLVADQASYSVDIAMPGCLPVTESLQVNVADASSEGTITPINILCSGTNEDSLVLTGSNGDILRWEMSNSLLGPWTTLNDTTPSLPFENIMQTTFFRSIVKSGTCPEVTQANPYEVVVNSPTVGGFVIGANTVCAGGNGGVVNLVYENGDVLWWESSNDNFATTPGTNIVNTSGDLSYANLTQTTQYRALVRSGVCDPFYSASVEIVVNAKPIPAFTSTTECKGFNTVFNSSGSASADGAITNYSWNFGNGSGSISSDPSYIYPAAGFYNVSLTIETDRGCTGSIPLNVQVYPLPLVDFTQAAVCLGAPMNFSVTSIPVTSVTSYDWDFGDGIGTDNVATPSYSYSTAGSFDVELIVTDTNGCIDSITKQVDITAPVDVSFICDSVCEGTPSSFINTSVSPGSTVQYSWYFGDGSVSPLANPSYTYSDTGTYIVALEAVIGTFPSTCTRVTQDTVVIFEVPQTNFTYTDVCQVDSSVFNSTTVFSEGQNNLTFLWDFDDASIGSTQDIKHKYLLPNTYSVELTASTASGCSSSISKLVSIYYMPTATFTFGNVCLGNPMNFANGSNITSGSLTYEWDFADGSFPSAVNQPVHLYSADNSYDVELIATSNNNCKDTVIQTITVHPLPVVGFIADPVCHFNTSIFDDTSSINTSNSPASLVSYSWDFGDGSSSTSADPSHNYLNDQTYNVILTVTSNKGCVSQLSQAVIVNPMPYPNFEVTDACVGAPVLFVNSTQLASGTTSYGWNFGDNNVSIATEPIHYYSVGGFYQVWLVATSGAGCVDSIPKYAEVFSLPLPNAGIDTSVSQGFPVGLEGYYSGAIGYNWTPIESLSNNTISNPDATPLETTTYYLEVTDAHGCQNVDSMVVNVIEDFKLFIYNVITPDGNGQNDTWKITNIETFEGADIYVYDRWGGEVLSVKGYQNDWEGVSGTDQLPDGTYYYVIKAIETDKVYKGSLTVLRNK
jgi:gliding motility-associated-like protein